MDKINGTLKATGERLMASYKNSTAVEHLHRYAIALDYVSGKIVLDIASGEGYGSNLLAQKAQYVYGVDISHETVQHAQQKYQKDNLRFVEGSAAHIPLGDKSIDVLISFETIEHHDQHVAMMKECKRVLKDDGMLIISSPDKKYYSDIPGYKNAYHVKELYKEDFFKLVNTYFPFVHLFKQGITMGSVIYNEDALSTGVFQIYGGDYDGVSSIPDIINPKYNLILAAQQAIPVHPNSYFESDFVNSELIAELANYKSLYHKILNSKSYKLTRILTLPVRALSKVFGK